MILDSKYILLDIYFVAGKHSEKPISVIDGITKMFPTQEKIELFARNNYIGWDNWGLEIPNSKIKIQSQCNIVR